MDKNETEVRIRSNGKKLPVVMLGRRGQPIGPATLEFDGGAQEPAGTYSFWSVLAGNQCTVVRTPPGMTLEDRLNEFSKMDRSGVDLIQNRATEIRPSAWSEIAEWLKTHLPDARHAKLNTLQCEEI